MKKLSIKFLMFLIPVSFVACKGDDEKPGNNTGNESQELITTVMLSFSDSNGGTQTVFFRDLDGVGGNAPTIDTINLTFDNAPYTMNMMFLDESDSTDVEDITAEIREEANDHLVCFTPTTGALSITISDKDGNNLDLGLQSVWSLSDAGTGSVNIALKHQPEIKNGQCNIGETDVEVDFPLIIN